MANYLIIGGSSGIGKAIVDQLKDEHNVFATYHHHPIEDPKVNAQSVDVMQPNFQDTLELPETLDGLVYCPGAINLKPFARFSEQDFINDYQLQVLGAIKTIQKALPSLKKSNQASVILFSTVAVERGYGFHSLVSTQKGALEGLTKALAAEMAPKVRFNCIAPSLTQTSLAGPLLNSEEKIDKLSAQNPMKRIGQPKDIANMATFLLSPKSNWITGQILHVDGGASTI